MFTLATLDTESHQEEGAWLHLCYPGTQTLAYTDEEKTKPARIKMKGMLSISGKETIARARNKAMKVAIEQGKSSKPEFKEETLATYEEKKVEDAKELAELAIGWENILDEDGKEVKFTKEAFLNAVSNAHDLRRQCREFIQDQTAFSPA